MGSGWYVDSFGFGCFELVPNRFGCFWLFWIALHCVGLFWL